MATQGPFRWFNAALDKIIPGGDMDLDTDTFKAILLSGVQAMDPAFVGASSDCLYADITSELATANGYTAGGISLPSVTLTRAANVVKWTSGSMQWTLTGTITFRYLVIFDDTSVNKDLLCLCDMNTDGIAIQATTGLLILHPRLTVSLNGGNHEYFNFNED